MVCGIQGAYGLAGVWTGWRLDGPACGLAGVWTDWCVNRLACGRAGAQMGQRVDGLWAVCRLPCPHVRGLGCLSLVACTPLNGISFDSDAVT